MGIATTLFGWTDSHLYTAISAICFFSICSIALVAVYNVYFHPLAKFPGPRLRAISEIPYFLSLVYGDAPQQMLEMHNRYGPVVRVAPNELTFISPVAFRDIHGHPKPGQLELDKDKKFYSGMGEPTLLLSNKEYHTYLRKLLAHGFSDAALRAQESTLKQYLHTLMERLEVESRNGQQPLDLVQWYNFFVFDVIAYLTYGESFDCLTNSELHVWVKSMLRLGKPLAFSQASERLPTFLRYPFLAMVLGRGVVASDYKTVHAISKEKVNHRLNITPTVPNFMDKLIEAHQEGNMTMNQLNSNATFLMAAGSGTLAFQLAHITYQLIMNPQTLSKLTKEIRTKFAHQDQITMVSVSHCKYLVACLDEALRIQAPAPITHPRYTPPNGISIDGYWVPGNVAVGIPIHAANQSPLNFRDPDKFIPERWTGEDASYHGDLKDAAQVFGLGPRDCLGRNLAFAEMRLVIASLLWRFDLEGCFPEDWTDQKVFLIWDKPPLPVKLRPVNNRSRRD